MTEVLSDLGVVVDHPADGVYEIAAGDVDWLFIPLEAAAKMRASFILLGPLLARFGRVIISNPGGDRIGRRPVNLHVDAMRALGAEIDYRNGYYYAKAPGRLRGGEVRFPQVTVMGTENAMLAATLADGHTVIRPAAQEPEVDDLIEFLRKMGADVARTDARHDRGPRQASASAARTTRSSRTGSRPARSSSRPRSPAARSRSRTRPATTSRRWSRCSSGSACRSPAATAHDRHRRDRPAARRPARVRHRDRALPGPRDRPPAADVRAADPGERHLARPRGGLRGPASSGWPS